jgi:hypothetical protein
MSKTAQNEYYEAAGYFLITGDLPCLFMPYHWSRWWGGESNFVDPIETMILGDRESVYLPGIADGATIRLPNVCPACGDTFPNGAKFCISCGATR